MDKPRFFTRFKPTDSPTTVPQRDNHLFGKIPLFILLTLAVIYIGFKAFSLTQQLSGNWQEVVFAFNKPTLVKSMRVQYEKKAVALDKEFTSGKTTDEKEIIKQMVRDEVAAQSKPSTFR